MNQEHIKQLALIKENQKLLLETDDIEFKTLIEEEIESLIKKLIPIDPKDNKNIILEIRPAAGGQEAELFANELWKMYAKYAENMGWKVAIHDISKTDIGGIKFISGEIKGEDVYKHLKYESGVHRVQRVPATEKGGRIHTSTATVAILPQVEKIDFEINPNDIIMDKFHSGGCGGQNVNKVETAIRLTYKPTGLVVTCQDERSQLKNKLKAMSILRSKLVEEKDEKERKARGDARRSQIGTGDRSEKIRTYNFPQDRITDHRIKKSFGQIELVLVGNLDKIIQTLQKEDYNLKKEEIIGQTKSI
jgi:peptide chain release factor 1